MIRLRRPRTNFVGVVALWVLIACDGIDSPRAVPVAEPEATDARKTYSGDRSPEVPAGAEILMRMAETVSTSDKRPGDSFEAVVVEAVTANDGRVLIPAGSGARGTVVESHQGSGADDPAVLVIDLVSIRIDGELRPLSATVVSAVPTTTAGVTVAETAGRIAIGAPAGAIIGQVVGNDTKTAVAGAAAGTVIALSTRKGNAVLEAGSVIRVRLNAPIPAR